ncbi:MAG: alpha-amylase family glycosyl hydrolase, partial [Thermoplasmata archaeon]
MAVRTPSATYRVQLSPQFGFDRAARIVPYLARLGVDVLYLSPILAARTRSEHGYDGVDPGRIDAARGGAAAFRRMWRTLRRHGMDLLVDIVPNHLAASLENSAWQQVLRRGPRAPLASIFDIDWERTADGRPAVVLPWLDRELPAAFSDGHLAFERDRSGLALRMGSARLPGSARADRRWRSWRLEAHRSRRGPATGLPPGEQELLERINRGAAGRDRARRTQLLGDLWYRLVPWWEISSVNYRRFFDISDLVGVRSDEPKAFAYMHRWLLRAARAGTVSMVRVDHIDGLADPRRYLQRLARGLSRPTTGGGTQRPYIVVEKILATDEALPPDWPVDGTTGYEALTRLTGVLVPSGARSELEIAYRRTLGAAARPFADEAYRAKREVARTMFPGERSEIVRHHFSRIRGRAPAASPEEVDQALSSLTAALSVYRTYQAKGRLRPADGRRLAAASREVHRREARLAQGRGFRALVGHPPWNPARIPGGAPDAFVRRWQQWSGDVAAKGVEDTAF